MHYKTVLVVLNSLIFILKKCAGLPLWDLCDSHDPPRPQPRIIVGPQRNALDDGSAPPTAAGEGGGGRRSLGMEEGHPQRRHCLSEVSPVFISS